MRKLLIPLAAALAFALVPMAHAQTIIHKPTDLNKNPAIATLPVGNCHTDCVEFATWDNKVLALFRDSKGKGKLHIGLDTNGQWMDVKEENFENVKVTKLDDWFTSYLGLDNCSDPCSGTINIGGKTVVYAFSSDGRRMLQDHVQLRLKNRAIIDLLKSKEPMSTLDEHSITTGPSCDVPSPPQWTPMEVSLCHCEGVYFHGVFLSWSVTQVWTSNLVDGCGNVIASVHVAEQYYASQCPCAGTIVSE